VVDFHKVPPSPTALNGVPLSEMLVVCRGYESKWDCWTNNASDFEVVRYTPMFTSLRFNDGEVWTYNLAEVQFATNPVCMLMEGGIITYVDYADVDLQTEWFATGSDRIEHAGLELGLTPLVPPEPRPAADRRESPGPIQYKLFSNWRSFVTDSDGYTWEDVDPWWDPATGGWAEDITGVLHVDPTPAKVSNVAVKINPKSRKAFLQATLSDDGGPWARCVLTIRHGKFTRKASFGVAGDYAAGTSCGAEEWLVWPLKNKEGVKGGWKVEWWTQDIAGNEVEGSLSIQPQA